MIPGPTHRSRRLPVCRVLEWTLHGTHLSSRRGGQGGDHPAPAPCVAELGVAVHVHHLERDGANYVAELARGGGWPGNKIKMLEHKAPTVFATKISLFTRPLSFVLDKGKL